MKKSVWVSVWGVIALSLGVFAVAGLIFLPLTFSGAKAPVGEEPSNIPYTENPKSSGVLYLHEDGSGALIFLNFEQKTTAVNIFLEDAETNALSVGYEINYTIKGTDAFLCELCDRLGGLDLAEKEVVYRFTGAGLAEKLAFSSSLEEKAEISEGFFKKISKIGFTREDFQFIVENTETNLNFPVCFSWDASLKDPVSQYIFENLF
jgi:hypothetical protein